MAQYTNSTLDVLGIATISSGIAIISAAGDDWEKSLAIGSALVLIGLICVVVKYKLRK